MIFIAVIYLVLAFAMLIAFFQMAANVREIKFILKAQTTAHLRAAYYMSLAKGDKEAVKEALIAVMFTELMEKNYTDRERYHLFEERRANYAEYFENIGADVPENPFKMK
jgi:hypothetical protein